MLINVMVNMSDNDDIVLDGKSASGGSNDASMSHTHDIWWSQDDIRAVTGKQW